VDKKRSGSEVGRRRKSQHLGQGITEGGKEKASSMENAHRNRRGRVFGGLQRERIASEVESPGGFFIRKKKREVAGAIKVTTHPLSGKSLIKKKPKDWSHKKRGKVRTSVVDKAT